MSYPGFDSYMVHLYTHRGAPVEGCVACLTRGPMPPFTGTTRRRNAQGEWANVTDSLDSCPECTELLAAPTRPMIATGVALAGRDFARYGVAYRLSQARDALGRALERMRP